VIRFGESDIAKAPTRKTTIIMETLADLQFRLMQDGASIFDHFYFLSTAGPNT